MDDDLRISITRRFQDDAVLWVIEKVREMVHSRSPEMNDISAEQIEAAFVLLYTIVGAAKDMTPDEYLDHVEMTVLTRKDPDVESATRYLRRLHPEVED